jgi:hypothetical protein
VAQLNTNTSGAASLIHSSLLGGGGDDEGKGIAIDPAGSVYVTGFTRSTDFPSVNPFQSAWGGGNDVFVTKLSQFAVVPNSGGNTGSVTVVIRGGVFQPGTAVQLRRAGQPDIVGTSVSVSQDGFMVVATFDLTEKAKGPWDVVMINPDGNSITLPGRFTVEAGRSPELWVEIVGRPAIGANQYSTYHTSLSGSGYRKGQVIR